MCSIKIIKIKSGNSYTRYDGSFVFITAFKINISKTKERHQKKKKKD